MPAGASALGSDSNLRLSAAEELRLLEHGARLKRPPTKPAGPRRGLGCGRFAWQHAAAAGARALGQPVGTIDAGFRADLVEIDSSHPLLTGLEPDELLNAFVFAADREAIRSVWVAEKRQVHEGPSPARRRTAQAASCRPSRSSEHEPEPAVVRGQRAATAFLSWPPFDRICRKMALFSKSVHAPASTCCTSRRNFPGWSGSRPIAWSTWKASGQPWQPRGPRTSGRP